MAWGARNLISTQVIGHVRFLCHHPLVRVHLEGPRQPDARMLLGRGLLRRRCRPDAQVHVAAEGLLRYNEGG